MKRFIRFCTPLGLCALPTSEYTLCLYAAFRFRTTTNGAKSFKNELYGIRDAHIKSGFRLDVSMQRLARLRDAWARDRGDTIAGKKPITDDIMRLFLERLGTKGDHQTFRAMLLLAKQGVLRVSEYSYGPKGNNPLISNLEFIPDTDDPNYMIYGFNKSKTNQYGRWERAICVCMCPQPCAIHEILRMLKEREPYVPQDRLFMLKNGDSPTAVGVNNLIINLCIDCKIDESLYRSHQLRSGGVCDLLTHGVPDSIVQELARWRNINSMVPYKKLSATSIAEILNRNLKK